MALSKKTTSLPEIYDLIIKAEPLPDEDPIAFDHLRQAFLADLSPSNPYETSLVEQIINLEWETQRARRLSNMTLVRAFGEAATEMFHEYDFDDAQELGQSLIGPNVEHRQIAEAALAEIGISKTGIMANAHLLAQDALELFDRKIMNLERRRRQLFSDFQALKGARNRHQVSIEDAEFTE